MRGRVRLAGVLALAAVAAVGCLAPGARASSGAEVGMEDGRLLFYLPDAGTSLLPFWKFAGVDVVRLHARWVSIAPGTNALTMPAGFHPTDPNDPKYDWGRLDSVVKAVRDAGMRVELTVTGSGPLWSSASPARHNPRWKPIPEQFAAFATAVARRYGAQVDRYMLYNEPNQSGWLQPQGACVKGRCHPVAPHLYRALVRAAYPAIKAADPVSQVLIGELAPIGRDVGGSRASLKPLTFMRAFGCVDETYRPIRTGECRSFRPATADGFAYHPHGVKNGPGDPNPDPDEAQIADLPRLFATLDRLTGKGRILSSTGKPFDLYLTEFGYQTFPPDIAVGVTPTLQARYLQQAAYLTWRNPRIKNLTHYEWEDEPIRYLGSGAKAFAGWQSGLFYADGEPKPAAEVFTHPFWVDPRPGGRSARLWGQVRPGGAHDISVQKRPAGSGGAFVTIARLRTNESGYWAKIVPLGAKAEYRYRYDVGKPGAGTSQVMSAAAKPAR